MRTAGSPASKPVLTGDPDGIHMACPAGAAALLAQRLPAGPVLELCCGLGGLTLALADRGPVVAVDRDHPRLLANRANLAEAGLAGRARHLCCDLSRPALAAPPGGSPFSAVVADPDWSPAGARPEDWSGAPELMRPPVPALLAWAAAWAPLLVLRLPAGPARDLRRARGGELLWPRPGARWCFWLGA